MTNKSHHLIFEGAELAGKSWIMSQVYNFLEPKYNESKVILDGCHWFNCDVGVYGTKYGKNVIKNYLKIFQELNTKNIIAEKFHIADIIYNRLHFKRELNYKKEEKKLQKNNFKIIFIKFPEDEEKLKKRIQDRLNLYPHYKNILKTPKWYINQQKEYEKEMKKTSLPYLTIETDILPDNKIIEKILKWICEK